MTETTIRALQAALARLLKMAEPFAYRVYNDNGDLSVSNTYLIEHQNWINLYFAHRQGVQAFEEAGVLTAAAADHSPELQSVWQIRTDKMLCRALGREWAATGFSIATLCEDVARLRAALPGTLPAEAGSGRLREAVVAKTAELRDMVGRPNCGLSYTYNDMCRFAAEMLGEVVALAPPTPAPAVDRVEALRKYTHSAATSWPHWSCPDCRGKHYAYVDEKKPNGKFAPGPLICCVNCKSTFDTRTPAGAAGDPVGEDAAVENFLDNHQGWMTKVEWAAAKADLLALLTTRPASPAYTPSPESTLAPAPASVGEAALGAGQRSQKIRLDPAVVWGTAIGLAMNGDTSMVERLRAEHLAAEAAASPPNSVPAPAAEPQPEPVQPPVKIRDGATYHNRRGDLVGPMFQITGDPLGVWYARGTRGDWSWTGAAMHASPGDDLVEEVAEPDDQLFFSRAGRSRLRADKAGITPLDVSALLNDADKLERRVEQLVAALDAAHAWIDSSDAELAEAGLTRQDLLDRARSLRELVDPTA